MKKNIPEIDDLLDGINDPDIMLHPRHPKVKVSVTIRRRKPPTLLRK